MFPVYKELLLQVDEAETAAAVLEERRLVELYLERPLNRRLVGNIFKGRVENVLPGMQAAFVNIGLEKNAFLYVEDALSTLSGGEETRPQQRGQFRIADLLKVGQEVMVQVVKEPTGTKGARVTTQITLPGRYIVLLPTEDYIGISRRIEEEEERERLKKLAHAVKPARMGMIVRTVAAGISEAEIREDVSALTGLWKKVQRRYFKNPSPSIVHQDLELLERVLRDLFSEEVDQLVVNLPESYERVLEILEATSPSLRSKVRLVDTPDLFAAYDIPTQIEQALKRKVWLKCGGYLVIDQMEALTAIDVNTGKYVGNLNLEDTVFTTNLEAAVEIARQLRLRNIGGIIVIDFIDMEVEANQQQVLKTLEEELKKDKTRSNLLGLTHLGLVEMTRKKGRQGLESVLQRDCPYCGGTGKVLSEASISLQARKDILQMAARSDAPGILVEANPAVASLLIGSGGVGLRQLERKASKRIIIKGLEALHLEEVRLCLLSSLEEIEDLAVPVKVGQILEVQVEEPHASNRDHGIARIQGFVLDIAGAGSLIGQVLEVEITRVFRTFARARLVGAVDVD